MSAPLGVQKMNFDFEFFNFELEFCNFDLEFYNIDFEFCTFVCECSRANWTYIVQGDVPGCFFSTNDNCP